MEIQLGTRLMKKVILYDLHKTMMNHITTVVNLVGIYRIDTKNYVPFIIFHVYHLEDFPKMYDCGLL